MTDLLADAQWIAGGDNDLPAFGVVFAVDDPQSAQMELACWGVAHVVVNGQSFTEEVLFPGYGDPRRSVERIRLDLSPFMRSGTNVIIVEMGSGPAHHLPSERWSKLSTSLGALALKAAVSVTSATGRSVVHTSRLWRVSTHATTLSSWVGGEDYDHGRRADYAPDAVARWSRAREISLEGVRVRARLAPPVRIVETRLPVSWWSAPSGTGDGAQAIVIDFGVAHAGLIEATIPADSELVLRPAELLDGLRIDPRTQGWGPVYHRVRARAKPIHWRPNFSYNGYRYVEISGDVERFDPHLVRSHVVRADVESAGSFRSSDERLNVVYQMAERSIMSNAFSVLTDCPQREKLGYLEQTHLQFHSLVRALRLRPTLENMVALMVEAQQPSGNIPLYVPEIESFPDEWQVDPNWGGAVVHLPWLLHREYGDLAILECAWDASQRYVDHLLFLRQTDGMLHVGLGDFTGKSVATKDETDFFGHSIEPRRSVALTSSASLYHLLSVTAAISETLGRTDSERWKAEQRNLRRAIHDHTFADAEWVGTVAELAVLHRSRVFAELDDVVLDRIERAVERPNFSLKDIGSVALPALFEALAARGRHDLLQDVCHRDHLPGYGYMVAHGATSLTETWDGPTYGFSQNHFMYASVLVWMQRDLAGIRQEDGSIGWEKPLISPNCPPGMAAASGSHRSPRGWIFSTWQRDDAGIVFSGAVPTSVAAILRLPNGTCHQIRGRYTIRMETQT